MKTYAIILILILIFFIAFIWSCKKSDNLDDNILPTCIISSPQNLDEFIKGNIIEISVDAYDQDGTIEEVQFLIDNVGQASVEDFPYNFNWNTNDASFGSHEIKAVGIDNDGGRTTDIINVIINDELPIADFEVNLTYGEAPLLVSFTNKSVNSVTNYLWDFGDGTTSTDKDPSKSYSIPGNYSVKLVAFSDYGSDTIVMENLILVGDGSNYFFTDSRDGKSYEIVKIGGLLWFKTNLNYNTANSRCYDDDPSNCEIYGRLYTWEMALTACPNGWHISSDEDWMLLEGTVDSQYGVGSSEWTSGEWRGYDAGFRLKSTFGWNGDGNGSDTYGFSILPAGNTSINGQYSYHLGYTGLFWTPSSDPYNSNKWSRYADYNQNGIARYINSGELMFSVRCVKD